MVSLKEALDSGLSPMTARPSISTMASRSIQRFHSNSYCNPDGIRLAVRIRNPISWLAESIDPRIEPPVGFDGLEFQYDQAFLLPWEGYFVRNLANEPLTVPLLRRAVSSAKTATQNSMDALYQLQLVAEVEGESLRDSQSFVGFAETATEGRDPFDLSEAPPFWRVCENVNHGGGRTLCP